MKPIRLTLRTVIAAPVAALLWPLVARNYRLRRRGLLPDKWYWADRLMFDMGWVVA